MEIVTNDNTKIVTKNSSCELVNVNGQIVAFCKTTDFKTYVKNVINDELFWRELLQRYSITSTVQNEVKNELNDKLPSRVSHEANRIVNKMVDEQNKKLEDKLNNYTQFQIPSHVSKSLQDQISGFLNNNVQMTQILSHHSNSLNTQLYNSATSILTGLVNEDQYHQVTTAHLSAMNVRFDQNMQIVNLNSTNQLQQNDVVFKNQLSSITKQVDDKLSAISDANRRIDNQNNKFESISKTISKLEKENDSLRTMIGVLFAGCFATICGVGYLVMKHK